jgi:PAS domain S-box-containing protein
MRVLIADDIESNRKLLTAVLEAEGMEILLANDGREALKVLRHESVDVVISDILMPHVDGYRLCYEVRKDPDLKDIPVIIHSASYTSPGDKKLAMEFGADKFIKKSSSTREILDALREVTSKEHHRIPRSEHSTADLQIMKEYSERLIEKLEERNIQLEGTKEKLTLANRELVQRTEELILSEEKFRGIIEHVQDVFFRANRRGIIEMVSPSIERYGYTKDELIGASIGLLCSGACHLRKFVKNLVRDHAVGDFELTLNKKDGGTFVGSISARVLKNGYGKDVGVDGFVRDITERKHDEEVIRERSLLAAMGADIGQALVHTETMQEMLTQCCDCFVNDLAATVVGIWTLKADTGVLEMQAGSGTAGGLDCLYNRVKAGQLELGLLPGEASPVVDNHVDPRITRQQWAREEGIVAFAGYPLIIENRLLGVVALFTRKPLSQMILEGITSCANSIALGIERKLDEEALRKAEEKYRSIFENSAEGIFQSLPSGKVITANPALARILGYESPEDLTATGHNISFHCADPRDREGLASLMEEQGFLSGMEVQFNRKDGSKIWALARGRAVKENDGDVLYYEGSLEDMTERKRLEEQLLQAQKMEAVGRLAGGVAHDFNNLLTAIIGYASLAAAKLKGQESIRHDIGEIEKAGRRAATLTNQLLVFSRRQVVQPRVLDLNSVVRGVEGMLRRLIGEDVDFSTNLDPNTGPIKADAAQVEQIILNLAVNSRDAMPDGGWLTIETGNLDLKEPSDLYPKLKPGQFVILAVSDSGQGMDKNTQSKIFEPFFTTKEIGKGTGLGLSTVYGIAEQAGGYVDVKSEPGAGTSFTLYFPRAERSIDPLLTLVPSNSYVGGTETILLVEDDAAVRALAKIALENTGYTVLDADNADAAMHICEQHKGEIHLAVTDIVMPGRSGPKLAASLISRRENLKLLYMSGYTDDSIARLRLVSGAPFLQKPFTPIKLAQKVREVLDKGK